MNALIDFSVWGTTPLIDARELHRLLAVQTRFSNWIKRRIEVYEFVEGKDFYTNLDNQEGIKGKNTDSKPDLKIIQKCAESGQAAEENSENCFKKYASLGENLGLINFSFNGNSSEFWENSSENTTINTDEKDADSVSVEHSLCSKLGKSPMGRPAVTYWLTLDTSYCLAVVESGEKGKLFREYLLKLKKAWNVPKLVAQRARQLGNVVLDREGVKAFLDLAVGLALSPFPGSGETGIPEKVTLFHTEYGGRVYLLRYPKRRRVREVVVYDSNGKFLQAFPMLQSKHDVYADDLQDFLSLCSDYKTAIGAITDIQEDATFLDYLDWRSDLIIHQGVTGQIRTFPNGTGRLIKNTYKRHERVDPVRLFREARKADEKRAKLEQHKKEQSIMAEKIRAEGVRREEELKEMFEKNEISGDAYTDLLIDLVDNRY